MFSKIIIHILSLAICVGVSSASWFTVKPRPIKPAILEDKRWGTHGYLYLKTQNIKIHYVEKGDRSKPLIVCFHGFPEFWFSWRYQLEEFSSDHWVVAVDMRGYGESEKPSQLLDYTFDKLVEDQRQIILELGKIKEIDWNKEQCTVMAHDWGGVLTWNLVSRYPQLFNCHISLNGPNLYALDKHRHSSFTQKLKTWYFIFFETPLVPEIFLRSHDLVFFDYMSKSMKQENETFNKEIIEAYKYTFAEEGALTGPINYYRNLGSITEEEKASKVIVPTLIIWGTDDNVLETALANLSATLCENVQIEWVAGAGHSVQMEVPVLVNEYIRHYFEKNLN